MPALAADQPTNLLPAGKRIVFLGDSNTFAGHYVVLLDAALRQANQQADIINLGLPSETASGLSEPDHPFPRPTVHERLERALAKTRPDVVFACYGMNDGIYYPFSKERFAAYQQGIGKLIDKVKESGAKIVLLTPPPFDPLPLQPRGKLKPAGEEKYSWVNMYEKYDEDVLARFAVRRGLGGLVRDLGVPLAHETIQHLSSLAIQWCFLDIGVSDVSQHDHQGEDVNRFQGYAPKMQLL